MKLILEFHLPEEQKEAQLALDGSKWYCVAWDMEQVLRDYLKYGHKFKSVDEVLENIRDILRESMNDHNLSF